MAWFNLGRVLDKKDWSMYRFAMELGVSPPVVTKYFRPGFEPNGGTLLKWCEVLDCKLDDLVDEKLDFDQKQMPRPKTATASTQKPKRR